MNFSLNKILQFSTLFCIFFQSQAAFTAPRRFALVVGNNTGIAGDNPLIFAEDDASKLAQTLLEYGGFNEEDLVIMLGKENDHIVRVLKDLEQRIELATTESEALLFVYYSGHADQLGLHTSGTILPHEELKDLVNSSAAQVKILILDACRSGLLTGVKGGEQAEEFEVNIDNQSIGSGTILISSSTSGENSHESDLLEGSVFSHHLTVGLLGAADLSGDLKVTLSEVYNYAYEHTLLDTLGTMSVQHPTFKQDMMGRHDLLLTDLSASDGEMGRILFDEDGLYMLLGTEEGPLHAEVIVKDNSRYLLMPADTYWVRIREPDHLLEGKIVVEEGQDTQVFKENLERIEYARLVRKGSQEVTKAFSVQVSGGVDLVGELHPDWGVSLGPKLEAGFDFNYFSLGFRFFYAQAESTNDHLSWERNQIGLSLSIFTGFDLGDFYFGAGLYGGVSRHFMTFVTDGEAPDRITYSPSFSVAGKIVWDISWGVFLQLTGGVEVSFFTVREIAGDRTASPAVPFVGLSLGWHIW